eukprot:COSAG02_NODE_486_length_21363_cov_22.137509_3_plen_65_part_00
MINIDQHQDHQDSRGTMTILSARMQSRAHDTYARNQQYWFQDYKQLRLDQRSLADQYRYRSQKV